MPPSNSSSSKRLLSLIKGGQAQASSAQTSQSSEGARVAVAHPVSSGRLSGLRSLLGGLGGRSRSVVGVEINPDKVTLVRVSGSRSKRLDGFAQFDIDPASQLDDPAFLSSLRAHVEQMAGNLRTTDVWGSLNSDRVQVWHTTIPKLSAKQVPQAVYWTVKQEKNFNESEYILDYEVQGAVMEKGVPKIAVLAYLAPRDEVAAQRKLFEAAGLRLAGLLVPTVALQNIFRSGWVRLHETTFANVFMGFDHSRVDVYVKDNLIFRRRIRVSVVDMLEAVMEGLADIGIEQGAARYEWAVDPDAGVQGDFSIDDDLAGDPDRAADAGRVPQASQPSDEPVGDEPPRLRTLAQMSDLDQARAELQQRGKHVDDAYVLTMQEALETVNARLLDMGRAPAKAAPLNEERIMELIEPVVRRFTHQVQRSLKFYTDQPGNDAVERVFLSGQICANKHLIDHLHAHIGVPVSVLDPMGPDASGVHGMTPPANMAARMGYTQALALALSDRHFTANLLHTYADKQLDSQRTRAGSLLTAGCMAAGLVLLGVYGYQSYEASKSREALAQVHSRIARFSPQLSDNGLLMAALKAQQTHTAAKELGSRYEYLALLGELSAVTPEGVQLLELELDLGRRPVTREPEEPARGRRAAVSAPDPRLLFVSGLIYGDPSDFDSTLATYLVRLQGSPLFTTASVMAQEPVQSYVEGEALKFSIRVEVAG